MMMVSLNADMKELFGKTKLFPVATASKAGVPNVAPIAYVRLVCDDTIWLADNFMNKTFANLKENPLAALYMWDPDSKKCFQIKGKVEITTSGPDFEKMKEWVQGRTPGLPVKSLIVMTVIELFQCTPGPDAGKKIL
jgi:predicted pyridoxine 5'-phosphate oxidase superfamily flavin-nucleotide-binding protein